MSSKAAEQDHSIEEILASIRQIISEDDQKSAGDSMESVAPQMDAPETAAPADFPLPPVADTIAPLDLTDPMPGATDQPDMDDDIFELVDRIDPVDDAPPAAQPALDPTSFDLSDLPDVQSSVPTAAAAPDPLFDNPLPPVVATSRSYSEPTSASVFTKNATDATLGAFSKLSDTILMERKRAIEGSTVTLEDIVKDLLQPLLREWIDHHVPGLVDRLVREELDKIARQTRDN